MHSNLRKHDRNRAVKSRLKTLEKHFLDTIAHNEKTEASEALVQVTSKLDKAAKVGVIHKAKANRKKSRLALKLNQLSESATAEATA